MKKIICMLVMAMMAVSVSQAALTEWFESFEDGTEALPINWDDSWNWADWSVTSAFGGNIPDGGSALLFTGKGGYMERSVGDAAIPFEVEFKVRVAPDRTEGGEDIFKVRDDVNSGSPKDLVAVGFQNFDATHAKVYLYNTPGSTVTNTFLKGADYITIKLAINPAGGTVDWYFNGELAESGINMRETGAGNGAVIQLRHYGGGWFRSNVDAIRVSSGDPEILSPSIVGISTVSSSMVKIEVKLSESYLADHYYPMAETDLVTGSWTNVPHSSDGSSPFVYTNLAYSSTDVSGSNQVIYVQTDDAAKFFKIMGE